MGADQKQNTGSYIKCPFCAEQIREEAILCRFCGATREGGAWHAPAVHPERARSRHPAAFTMRTAGAFFIASAVVEAFNLTGEVPLFGAMRSGAAAIAYHAVFTALFMAMGDALWSARRWGLQLLSAGTLLYTLDKIRYVYDTGVREADLVKTLDSYGLRDSVDLSQVFPVLNLAAAISVLCWWGFLLYLLIRRDYFNRPSA